MTVVLVANIHPVAEHRDAVIAIFEATIARVHAEDEGCELYALHEGKKQLVVIEKWTSQDALAAHGRGPALVELNTRLAGKVIGDPELHMLRPHPAGTPQQGTL
jgi:quinol monooxygenase YgiN